jgi:hypothetical protein
MASLYLKAFIPIDRPKKKPGFETGLFGLGLPVPVMIDAALLVAL